MKLRLDFETDGEEYNALKKVYEDLSDEKLLGRCLRKATQNANESLHFRIWGLCPKVIYFSRPILEFALNQSMLFYHLGYVNGGHLHEKLGIPITKDMLMEWSGQERAIKRNKEKNTEKEATAS